jgi:threonine dehydrogenase-like Zn-dependent dehydrogenase
MQGSFIFFLKAFHVSRYNSLQLKLLTCFLFAVEVGACIEPLAVAWHAVEISGYKQGQSALIIGAGPVSLIINPVGRS